MTEERYRHKKRGSTYTVIARGFLQVDGDLDNEKVVVYRGEDGRVWVRPEYEFNDGRFERLPDAKRETFEVPEGHEAVRDADGRATGEVRNVGPNTTTNLRVTEAMVNAADSVLSRSHPGIPDETIRFAIEAAIASACMSPVPRMTAAAKRWLLDEHLPGGSIRWQCYEHEHQSREVAKSSEHKTTVTPLYSPPAPQVTGGLWDQLTVLSGYYITQPPTPDHEFVQVCNGDLRKMVELMNTSVQAPAPQVTVTAEDYNAAFDPANAALGGAFKDGFREGWLFAKDPCFDNREELEADYSRSVDIAPSECWDAYRSHYFAMLPLAAIPDVGEAFHAPAPQVMESDNADR